jgi:glyoxylase-like metal-dependent hydrolase (beta-lactamase superfamily II)
MSAASYSVFPTFSGAKIHRLPLQVFPNFWAYAYLVFLDGQRILIDTGSGTEASHQDLLNGLQQAGISPADLTHILITHAHIDHFGGLARLKPLSGAKIGCHNLDVQTVAHHEARLALISRRLASFLAESGLAKEDVDSLLSIYRFTKTLYRSVPVDFVYSEMAEYVPALEMTHLPGHCPGHVAMRLNEVVFIGDMLVEGVTPHLAPESLNPYGGVEHYLASLSQLQRFAEGADLFLSGHNDAFFNLAERIHITRQNILRRMERLLEALARPLTIVEACRAVYGEMSGYNQLLIIEKTGAYIEYLYEHGMIEVTNFEQVEQGEPARYRMLREVSKNEILPKEKNYVLI